MRRSRLGGLWVSVALSALVGSVLVSDVAVADQVQVDLNIVPNCDTTTGHWKVDYLVHNQTPVTVVFERAEDPTTGAPIPVPPFPLITYSVMFLSAPDLPGDRTSTGLHVWIRRVDRSEAVRYGTTFTLPGPCTMLPPPPQNPPDCVDEASARYVHTFDGAAGFATVELVGKPLCPGEWATVFLASTTDTNPDGPIMHHPFDESGAALSATRTKAALRVTVPPCAARVVLVFSNPYSIAGAPGSQSTGPHALYQRSGGVCVTRPEVSSTEGCDGTVRITLANGSTANTPVEFMFVDVYPGVQGMFRTLVLEPGESTTVPYTLPMPRGQIDIYIKSVRVLSARVPTLLECRMQAPPPATPQPPPPPRWRRSVG